METDVCISLASLGQAGFAKITPASAAPSSTFDLSVWLATACIGSANLQETVPVDDCTVVGPTSVGPMPNARPRLLRLPAFDTLPPSHSLPPPSPSRFR